jgi:hypothetical protein
MSMESRDDVLHIPNLYEYFCQRTADDFLAAGGDDETPAVSFVFFFMSLTIGVALFLFGRPQLAKAVFVGFGLLTLWTIWGVVVRSSSKTSQKAADIRAGNFPPETANLVLARLKWWNHLVAPKRWAKHSRLFDRRAKLERKIEEIQRRIDELTASGTPSGYAPPSDEEVAKTAAAITAFPVRKDLELQIGTIADPLEMARAELALHRALLHKATELGDRLDRIEKLQVVFQKFSAADLASIVSQAVQVLEERRILVIAVDRIDADSFIDLITVRVD